MLVPLDDAEDLYPSFDMCPGFCIENYNWPEEFTVAGRNSTSRSP